MLELSSLAVRTTHGANVMRLTRPRRMTGDVSFVTGDLLFLWVAFQGTEGQSESASVDSKTDNGLSNCGEIYNF